LKNNNDFSVGLALLDYVPVAAFGAAIVTVAASFSSALFLIGAVISLAAGMLKATWKLIYGASGRDIVWMNKPFVPLQSGGWLLMLAGVLANIKRIEFVSLFAAVSGLPQLVLFILWLALLGVMVWYRKNCFGKYDARSNWTAEIINSAAQLSFLAAVLCAA